MSKVAAGWAEMRRAEFVFVCRKCGKRAGRKGVRSELKSGLKAAGHRRARVVETGCLALCPKAGIAIGTAASLARGRVFILDRDAPADDAVAALIAAPDQSSAVPTDSRD